MSFERLATQRICRNLDEDTVRAIYGAGTTDRFEPGEIIVSEGNEPKNIYFILDGEVDVYISDPDEPTIERRINTLVTGDCIGEYGFVDGRPASATVRSSANTELLVLPFDGFRDILRGNQQAQLTVYENLLESLVERLRTNNIVIEFLNSRDRDEVD